MLDIKLIRKHPRHIEEKLRHKGTEPNISHLLALDEEIRSLKTETEAIQAQKNHLSKEIGLKKQKNEEATALRTAQSAFGEDLSRKEKQLADLETQLHTLLAHLPNLPMDDIPISPSPKDNVCIQQYGEKKCFPFPFKNHVELNERLHFFDFPRATKLSGSGWPLYRGIGARLEWALLNYMLDIHRKNGFTQIIPPLLMRPEVMFASAHLPKFEEQLFKLKDEEFFLYLVPTSETALNGLHLEEILDATELPLKYTAYTPCFRREAGAAGSQERGLIRTHQFNKVELFAFTRPEESARMFEEMLASAEEVLQGLGLHYRNMLLTTGDMSFAAAKTVDIEVWLPGQNRYYEVSSVSNCTDFQARRGQTRFRSAQEKPEFVHTLNGSGLATSRLMVALLENHQEKDGSILVPKVLQRYLGEEMTIIRPS